MTHQLGRAAGRLAVQLCSAGRPAMYKLAPASKGGDSSEDDATLGLVRLATGQSGVRQVGEDALFVRSDIDDVIGFGVADGVGGWREQGVDPGKASFALLAACADVIVDAPDGRPGGVASLKSVLASAHRGLLTSQRDLIGSTTVCLARLTPATRQLEVANLGDSGLCVVDSAFRLKMRTRFQSNMGGVFNCPMQLAFPSALSNQYPKPEDCELYSVIMEPGDIAMVATDGLWDNLYQPAIEGIFRHAFQKSATTAEAAEDPLEAAAKFLVDAATYLSVDQKYFSPFCQNAKEAGLKYIGGKEDDISVVLARLCPEDSEACSGPAAKL